MARSVLEMHEDYGMHNQGDYLPKLERQLAKEMADGESWFAKIEANERKWIAADKDVDREFAAVYYDSLEGTLSTAKEQVENEWYYRRRPYYDRLILSAFGLICIVPITAVIGVGLMYWIVRRSKQFRKSHSTSSTTI